MLRNTLPGECKEMKFTQEEIIEYIDELFLCVRNADWNCCHPDKNYDTWTKLSYPKEESLKIQEQLKSQILDNQKLVDELKKILSVVIPHDISDPNDPDFIRYDYVRNDVKNSTGKDIQEIQSQENVKN